MKHRTNQERAERKHKKAIAMIDSRKKSLHISYLRNADYHTIISSVKSKTSHWTIRNAHARKNIEKLVLVPKIFFTGGTYRRKEA